MSAPKSKILVIKLSALGDFIQALGPMVAIRKHHKDAHITLLTTKMFEKFARQCGYFDDVILDIRPKLFDFKGWLKLSNLLNDPGFTRVYDLQNNDRTALYLRLFRRALKPEWVGAAPGASHRNVSPERTAGHAFDGHVQTLSLAGIKSVEVDRLEWMQGDVSGFALQTPFALLVPGCAPDRPEKRWPAKGFGALANMLYAKGVQPVLLGTNDEADAIDQIKSICPDALDLMGQTDFYQLVTLGREADMAIGNDTGPMHMIGATGTQSLVLFSQYSDPVRHAPKGANVSVVQVDELLDLKPEDVLGQLKF